MKPEAAPSCLEQKTPLPKFAVIPDLCSGCGSVIRDRFLLRVNERSWHERCLRCCACGLVLAGNSCFSRECRIYCRHDYLRLFPRRCSRCRGALGGSERIQKVLEFLFHERCLRCCSCSRRLRSGDRFVLRHGRILCPREPEFPGNPARSEEEEEEDSRNSRNSRNSRDFSGKDPKRSKRPRTVLSWQQRRAFRESFRISAKPCRKVRESLAAQTGLTVRVVQVWFQNQRAKMKKLARRQQQEQLGNSRGEIPEGRRGRDRDRDRDRDEEGSGIFQEPPGDAPGSTENSQRVNLGNAGIPRIPEPGNPLERLYPGIPGIPEPGNPLEQLYPGIPGIPEFGNPLERLYPGIPEFGNPLERLYPGIPGIPGIPEPGNALERLYPGIPEFGNGLEQLYPGIPGIPEPGNGLERLYPGIPEFGNGLEWLYPGIPGIPEPGNPMERLFSMQSSYFTS